MRIVTPITLLAAASVVAFLTANGNIESIKGQLPFQTDVTEAQVAVQARCGDLRSWMRRTCEEDLEERFAAGNVTPEGVLRMHCTRAETVWKQTMPEPPALCAARFGGWITS
jgi:hypothetical protein